MQKYFRIFPFARLQAASLNISELNYYLIEWLNAIAALDVFVVIFDPAVVSSLLCIVLRESLAEQFIIHLANITANINYVVGYALTVHIVGDKLSVVMAKNPVVDTERNR